MNVANDDDDDDDDDDGDDDDDEGKGGISVADRDCRLSPGCCPGCPAAGWLAAGIGQSVRFESPCQGF